MDNLPLLLGVTLLLTALSGCAGDDGGPVEPTCDPMTSFVDANGVCTMHTEPSITATLPGTVPQYAKALFTWSLDNGTRGEPGTPVHSMDNRLVAIVDGSIPDNTTDPREAFPGVEFARQEHQNLPVEHNAGFSWPTQETVAIWGYMRIDGIHIWQQLGTIDVVAPLATGNTVTITISGTGIPSADRTDVSGTIGDTITFDNQHQLASYTITFDADCGLSALTASSGQSASTPPILAPLQCGYTADNQVSGVVQNLGRFTGSINILPP